jgi:molybdopterin-containing oxidoreductase family iron-sulfur binding subunit
MSHKGQSRSDFLKVLLAAFGGLMAFVSRAFATKGEDELIQERGEHRWGMVIDLDRCTGCQACVVACSVENNQMLGSPEEAAMGRIIRWLKILPITSEEGSQVRMSLIPMPCQQCEDPPCTRVCPTSATFMNPEGIVGQVYNRCIGCRYCVNACPYTCKFFNWGDLQWPSEVEMPFNPDVSVRYKGVVEKCLFCHQRLQRAKDRARAEGRKIQEGDYIPACVSACPAQAIAFGNLKDPESQVSKLATSRRAYKILEELGTKPKVIYLREG